MRFLAYVAGLLGWSTSPQSLRQAIDSSDSPGASAPSAEELICRGLATAAAGNHGLALSILESAIALQPDSGAAYRGAGEQAFILGDNELALDYLQLAVHYLPDDHQARLLFARACLNAGLLDRAAACLELLYRDCPQDSQVVFERARCLYMAGNFSAAAHCLERHLTVNPGDAAALNFLGLLTARDLGEMEAGEALVRRALAISPGFLAAKSNLGWILAERGGLSEAMTCFDQVLDRAPGDAETTLMRAQARLKQGMFKEGWQDFSARHKSPLAVRRTPLLPALPDGAELPEGCRLLLVSEQGIGDQIMFASCIPDLLAQGCQVTLECHRKLRDIFARSFPRCNVISDSNPIAAESLKAEHDFHLFLGDLPGRFRNTLADFPETTGYLIAHPEKTRQWRKRLEALGPGPYVGISWRGGTRATRRQLRSVEPQGWAPILASRGCHISLQYGDCADDLVVFRDMGAMVHHWPEAIDDYEETAALIAALDVVVSVCTAVVHLTGALGRVAHVLTPAQAEWRYLDRGARLPWYPSVVLHRQEKAGNWEAVVRRIAAMLG